MSGVRIHHPTEHSCVLIVPHPGNDEGRKPKDYFIHLDSGGNAIVSETVWARLQEAQASGLSTHQFEVLNEVDNPPTILMRQGGEVRPVATRRQTPNGVRNADMLAVAQEFAPKGIKPRIV